ncbi:hypothetical protein [Streptomyces chryseus]|uniref:hypothetical protein n=1 Tax=Streptomyces chryseus TaxID=68186 RepID=UPI00142F1F39|nr:hypothetical protein [Streptomyces chryseus]
MTTRQAAGGPRSERAAAHLRARGSARRAGAGAFCAPDPGRVVPPVPRTENFRTEEHQS